MCYFLLEKNEVIDNNGFKYTNMAEQTNSHDTDNMCS